jgi:hypothetical protein
MAGRPTPEEELRAAVDQLAAENGNQSRAALALGIPRETFRSRLQAAARLGIGQSEELRDDITDKIAEGFTAKGYSHLTKTANGELIWLKADKSRESILDGLRAAANAMAADIKPCAPITPPATSRADLLTLYTFTDYHVGMLAWHKEGGDDWDLAIAERLAESAMAYLTAGSPDSEHGVVNIQGDFLHWDGLIAITPQHGHVLDADGRFGKVVDVAIRIIRRLVALALAKHKQVTLLICEGNHDIASSLWLRKLFCALYENEPRIVVHDSELPYYAIEWGKVLLGFHHGHLKKNEQLPALFATQFRQQWGRCPKVYIHTGHRHHLLTGDKDGARITQHPTLASRDAYAARGGWWSEREITAITYSKQYGWAGSLNTTPEMLEAKS